MRRCARLRLCKPHASQLGPKNAIVCYMIKHQHLHGLAGDVQQQKKSTMKPKLPKLGITGRGSRDALRCSPSLCVPYPFAATLLW